MPEVETLEGRPVPAGEIVVGPDDLFVSHAEGDLWLYPGMLSDSPAEPYRVVDVGDPREPETEGPGPNQVDHVAGVFNGSVIYGDCCEPIAGNVLLAPRADSDRIDWIHGYTPSVSPDGTRLVTAAVDTLSVVELSTGAHRSRALNELGRSNVNVWGVSWATDSSVVVLYFDDSGFALAPYDADSLRQSAPPTSLDVAFDPEAPSFPSFVGHGRNGEVALAASDETSAVIRFFDAATLAERSEQKRVVPNGAEFIRLAEDGIGMLWMEDDRLWYHPAGGGPRTLGTGYIAAWFAL